MQSDFKNFKLTSFVAIILVLLSLYLYQFNVALYYTIFLIPFLLMPITNSVTTKLITSLIIWLGLNTLILSDKTHIIDLKTTEIISVNVLIVTWVNCIVYFYFFYELYEKNISIKQSLNNENVQRWLVFFTIISNLIILLSLGKYNNYNNTILIGAIIYTIVYTYLLRKLLSVSQAIYANFLIALSPIISVISAWIIMLFILRTLYFPEVQRPGMLLGITFLQYFQVLSISSLIIYFTRNRIKIQKYTNQRVFLVGLLAIVLSIGIIVQKLYFNFLYY